MHRKTRRFLLTLVALAAAGGIVVGAVAFGRDTAPAAAEQTPAVEPTTPADGTAPASAAPTTAATSTSTAPVTTSTSSAAPTTSRPSSTGAAGSTVDVMLTYADWDASGGDVEAGGFVDAVESGGSCTLTLTSGAAQVSVSSGAEPDATTTNCGRLTVPANRLTAGPWTAVLTYHSARSAGASQPATVTVPAR